MNAKAAFSTLVIALTLPGCTRTPTTPSPPPPSVPSARLHSWPPPEGLPPSAEFGLRVNGSPVFVWPARVRQEIRTPPGSIWTHDLDGAAQAAAFALFDFSGAVDVEIQPNRPFSHATLLPLSAQIIPSVSDGIIRFRLPRPGAFTLLLDDSDDRPLHLLSHAPEPDLALTNPTNNLRFGPGRHPITQIRLSSGQTLDLAGAALLTATVPTNAAWHRAERIGLSVSDAGPVIHIQDAQNVQIRGRGVLDGGQIPHAARPLIVVERSRNVAIQGIVLLDSPSWNVTIQDSENVLVDGVRVISGRLNSDGINTVNSRNVVVRNCFVRNHDDGFAIKTTSPGPGAQDITIEQCTVWSDWGYALGVTYETRAPIQQVVFRNCDILFVRHWALGVYVVDSATVRNVLFDNIRVESMDRSARRFGGQPLLLRVMVSQDMWATDAARGRIEDVTFRRIRLEGTYPAGSEIRGLAADHPVERVTFEEMNYLGVPVSAANQMNLLTNDYVRDLRFR